MRWMIATAFLAMACGSAVADDKVPGHNGLTIGTDGKMWRMEGCAAYPVEAQAGAQSKPVATAPVAEEKPAKLAKSDKVAE